MKSYLVVLTVLSASSLFGQATQLPGSGPQGPPTGTNAGNVYSKAVCDNSTDNTTAIAAEITALNAANGGTLVFPAGICITGPQTINNYIIFRGAGKDITFLKLKTGSNASFFAGSVFGYSSTIRVNIAAAGGAAGWAGNTGGNTGNLGWGFQNITLDGNYTNQSGTSRGIEAYGYNYILWNVGLQNFLSECAYLDYNAATNPASFAYNWITNVEAHECHSASDAFKLAGPTDVKIANLMIHNNTGNDFHLGPNAAAAVITEGHFWAPGSPASGFVGGAVAVLNEAAYVQFVNASAEGSNLVNIAWIALGGSWYGGHIFGINGTPTLQVPGIQFGQQAGQTCFLGEVACSGTTTAVSVSQMRLDAEMDWNNPTLAFNNLGNNNSLDITATQTTGTAYYSGNPGGNSSNYLRINGQGLTADGTDTNGSILRQACNSFNGYEIFSTANNAVIFDMNCFSAQPAIYWAAGATMGWYSDALSTLKAKMDGSTGKLTTYVGVATVDNGVPSEQGHSDLTAQTAALTTSALMTPGATGMYRVSYYAKVTTAGTTSILGGTTGFVLNYTDGTDSVAQTLTLTEANQSGSILSIGTGNTTNTTAAIIYGTTMVYAKTGVAMTYNLGYTSTGTAMQYEIHVKVEAL